MAMLAAKSPFPTSLGSSSTQSSNQYTSNMSSYRTQPSAGRSEHAFFASPTESEFSETYDGPDAVRHWDEDKVADWLRSINCGHYVDLFKKNNINGEVLMEMDQASLKDMGIRKIGDRVRIGSQAKLFRNREYKKASKKNLNRRSLASLDNPSYTPPSSGSPRPLYSARSIPSQGKSDKRMSRQLTGGELNYASSLTLTGKSISRPGSPLVDQENRGLRSLRQGTMNSPKDGGRKDATSYFSHPPSASSGRTPGTDTPQTARFGSQPRTATSVNTPQTARFASHVRSSPSVDTSVTNSSILPADKPLIRVIFDNGRISVFSVDGCKTADEIILKTLKKGNLNETHIKNYCMWVLDGVDPNPAKCRRLTESDLVRVCHDRLRMERGRLILRKLHAGEPEDEQLKTAASIAAQQQQVQRENIRDNIVIPSSNRSQLKIEKITGESLAAVSYPLSPTSARERERHINSTAQDLERADSIASTTSAKARKLKRFYGARPPSELITSDLTSYFPDVEKEEIDKTIRMSVRRSRRISRATSRLSTASNFSVASSLRDAPPLPSIADQWFQNSGQARPVRPLSVMRLGLPSQGGYRDSVASSVLEPLEEESPLEPSRKSYVSFGDDNADRLSITDPDGNTMPASYFDDAGSSIAGSSSHGTEAGDSLNKRLSEAIRDDEDESDEELTDYLEQDSWENVKYMKGALIGQGSFGSVYLALHAVTGELMAVKQVEMPSSSGTSQLDQRKTNMVEALKHEIGLLRDLKHPNIVQYLGSNSVESHLNIFLEYVPGGSVASMLVNYGPLGEGLIGTFVRQILTGLAYLHSKDIIHRDIKGANILVDNKGSVKISDFGISKRVEASTLLTPGGGKKGNPRVSLQGSVFWMAPEVVRQTAYTRKADIWSLGCLIVEMFTGSHPHPNCTQLQAIFKIGGSGDASPTVPDNAGEDARAFLQKTFEIDHEKRPTADELLLSPFCNPKA
ncbi:protein kinase byr2 [Pseudovirgaria hyperparasitica]|uniref:mitogen-activated protein kinase kinase kinase n=1 Tax=Pseudovirgaria hyperparasitica TaxID=470096 RepID=A0A6A6WE94_9PEZI|nr:protein kinase byr2 [Pseudovirgaria hyperparasitica]KAF2760479.1 protein kinase byr2 [Pseudovirgaria hyperparasitica]